MRVRLRVLPLVFLVLAVLAACDSSIDTPTQPPPPTISELPTAVTGNYTLYLGNDEREYPESVEILFDGEVIFTGPLWSYYYYDPVDPPYASGGLGSEIATGRHTFSLRILQSKHGRETFHLSAYVNISLVNAVRQLDSQSVSWDETVRLGPGDAWTREFEVREWSGGQ